jgi:hypothetical protein
LKSIPKSAIEVDPGMYREILSPVEKQRGVDFNAYRASTIT